MKKCSLGSYVKSLSKSCNVFTCIASAVFICMSLFLSQKAGVFELVKTSSISDLVWAIIPAVLGALILGALIGKTVNSKKICASDSIAIVSLVCSIWALVSALTSIDSEYFVLEIVTFAVLFVFAVALLLVRVKFFDEEYANENSVKLNANANLFDYTVKFVKKYLIFAVLFSAVAIVGLIFVEKANFVAELFNDRNHAKTTFVLMLVGLLFAIFFIERIKDKDMNFVDVIVFMALCVGVTFAVYACKMSASTRLVAGAFAMFAIVVSILMSIILIQNTHLSTKEEVESYKQTKPGVKTYFTAFVKSVNVASVIAVSLIIAGVVATLLLTNSASAFMSLFVVHNSDSMLFSIVLAVAFAVALAFADVALHRIETMDVIMVSTAIVSLFGLIVDQLVMQQKFMLGGLFFTLILALSLLFIVVRIFFVKLLPVCETAKESVVVETQEEVISEQVVEPETVEVKEEVKEEPAQEVASEETAVTVEPTQVEVEIKQKRVNVKKSFEIYLRTGDEQLKDNYTALKNEFLSYGIHARMTKARENFSKKGLSISKADPEKNVRLQAKLLIRGKFLKLYLNVDPQSIDAKYFRTKDVSDKMPDQATYIKVRSKLSLKRALELINLLAEKEGFTKKKKFEPIDYKAEYTDENLSYMEKLGYDYMVKESVTYDEVLGYKEEWAERAIKIKTLEKADRYIYDEVSLDDLSKVYSDGDEITLESLREKELIKINCNYLTVTASKKLSKKLFVEAHEIDLKTAQMIIIAGGEVTKIVLN